MFCRRVFGNISGGFRGISRFLGISRDFAEIPEFRGSATARIIRSPVNRIICELDTMNFASDLLWFNGNKPGHRSDADG